MKRTLLIFVLAVVVQSTLSRRVDGAEAVPFLELTSSAFEESEQSLILGRLEKVARPENGREIQSRLPAKLTIRVERVLLGPKLVKQELKEEVVWYDPSYYLALEPGSPRVLAHPRVGDRVFYWYLPVRDPTKPDLFRPRSLGQATDSEIKRIDRAKEIVSTKDSREATRRALEGCADTDPYFAIWCLGVLRPEQNDDSASSKRVFGPIRSNVTFDDYSSILWETLQKRSTHPVVYQFVDRRLETFDLSAEQQYSRHQCHLQRMDAIFAESDSSNFSICADEIRYLLSQSYRVMPNNVRLDALQWLEKRMPTATCNVYRSVALGHACALYDPDGDDGKNYAALLRFYREFNPLHRPELQISVVSYGSGLVNFMKTHSDRTRKICSDGVEILEEIAIAGGEERAWQAASALKTYAHHCEDKKIERHNMRDRLKSIRNSTPQVGAKRILNEFLEQWDMADESADRS